MSRSFGIAGRVARWAIQRSARTRFAGSGGFSPESFTSQGIVSQFPQAEFERDHFDELFQLFSNFDVRSHLVGNDILDFGSGYGGKTVEYKRRCGAQKVCGTEPHPRMVELSREYAAAQQVDVEFAVCSQSDVPYPEEAFDVVITHDVLEHVADPRVTMREVHRVLRGGGLSINIFPVYFGAKSHHLDYVTLLPALHWAFSAQTLVQAVNTILIDNPQYGTAPQPEPQRSFDGARFVLPGLNGLSGAHLETLFQGFEVVSLRRIALGPRGMGLVVNSWLPPLLKDLATATVTCVLRKH